MNGSQKVIAALQQALLLEAQSNEQYRVDSRSLKFTGLKKAAAKVDFFGDRSSCFRKTLLDRVLLLGGTPSYSVGSVTEQDSLTALFINAATAENGLVAHYATAIGICVDQDDETSAEKLRHIQERHEDNLAWIEKQQRLIAAVGGEAEYVAAKI